VRPIVSIAPTWIEADSRTLKTAASFARAGYSSIVVEGGTSDLAGFEHGVSLRSMGTAPRAPAEATGLRLLRPILVLCRILWRSLWKPFVWLVPASLYYLHSPYQFPGVFLRAQIHRAPFIYDAHDFYSAIDPPSGRETRGRRLLRWYHRRLEAACVHRAASVVTVSSGVARLITEAFGTSCVVVRNCHDSRLDRCPNQGIRQALELPDSVFLLVAVGQAKAGAAVEEAAQALRELPDHVHFAFLGRDFEQRLRGVTDLVGSRLHIVRPVKPYEVVPFIRSADAALILYHAVSPNYRHCLPNGFFQAIAAELPLLYPELPDIREIAEAHGIGLPIDPLQPSTIARSALRLLEDHSLHSSLKANLRAAGRDLSWEQEEMILITLIERVLADRSR
jgi:glycosyltransferase involved in cell wall biosynthesis